MKIHLILTGGTIGSEADDENVIKTNTQASSLMLVNRLYQLNPSYKERIDFDVISPIDILSENLTLSHWNALISHLKAIDYNDFDALIITHGTDTLAFTANLLAILFEGIDIPVFLIASSKPLTDPDANGFANFHKAVQMIEDDAKPSVYVPFKNKNGEMNVHDAGHLIQSSDLSPDFESAHPKLNEISKIKNELIDSDLSGDLPLLYRIQDLNGNILCISPYPGLNYGNYDLSDVDAVLHRTYHSSTMSADGEENTSVFYLKNRCDELDIPLYFAPILSTSRELYSSTDNIKKRGIIPLFDMTFEMSYIYLLVKYSM